MPKSDSPNIINLADEEQTVPTRVTMNEESIDHFVRTKFPRRTEARKLEEDRANDLRMADLYEATDPELAEKIRATPAEEVSPETRYHDVVYSSMKHDLGDPSEANMMAIEAQMIQKDKIGPLKAQIEQAEAELTALEQKLGAHSNDERLAAKKEELNDLYTELDTWETRTETLKANMHRLDSKKRLEGVNIQEKIYQVEQEILELKATPGIEPDYERLNAKQAEIADLQERLASWQNRTEEVPASLPTDAAFKAKGKDPKVRFEENPDFSKEESRQANLLIAIAEAAKSTMNRSASLPPVAMEDLVLKTKEAFKKRLDSRYRPHEEPTFKKTLSVNVDYDDQKQQVKARRNKEIDDDMQWALDQAEDMLAEVNSLQEQRQELIKQSKAVSEPAEVEKLLAAEQMLKDQQNAILQNFSDEKMAEGTAMRSRLFLQQEIKAQQANNNNNIINEAPESVLKERFVNLPTRFQAAERELLLACTPSQHKAQLQQYQNRLMGAAEIYKVDPSLIQDPGKKDQVMDLKQKIADAEAELARLRKKLIKLPGSDKPAKEELASLQKQLDEVLVDCVSDNIKLGILENQVQLAKLENNVAVQAPSKNNNNTNAQPQIWHKPTIGEMIGKPAGNKSIGQRPQAIDQLSESPPKEQEAKGKSNRNSGSWKAVKPTGARNANNNNNGHGGHGHP